MSNQLVVLDGMDFQVLEYKGKRVITTSDIARYHSLEVRVVNQKFRRNKKYFTADIDYFEVSMEEVRRSQIVTASKYDSSQYLLLITDSGYLKYIKTINDDKAWDAYNKLVTFYFENKDIVRRLDRVSEILLTKSTEHRNSLIAEWARHGARNYKDLTLTEYRAIFHNKSLRKRSMSDDQKIQLSMFEYLEGRKLDNNPQIQGDFELTRSLAETGMKFLDIIKPQKQLN